MRALIIGSSGFLGSHLLELLGEQNLQVDCCNRQSFKGDNLSFSGADLEKIEPIYDTVFLVAAHIPYGNLSDQSELLEKSNIRLVQRVVKHFSSSRIIFCSSVSVYGYHHINTIDENYPLTATSAYGKSKLHGEDIVNKHRSYAILRFSSLYGQKMTAATFLPRIIHDALTKQEITLYGTGERLQNYLFAKDAAKMLLLAAKHPENLLCNAVFPRSYSNKYVAELVASIIGNVKISYRDQDSSSSYCYSLDKWRGLFDYLPETSLEQGISLLIDDIKQQIGK